MKNQSKRGASNVIKFLLLFIFTVFAPVALADPITAAVVIGGAIGGGLFAAGVVVAATAVAIGLAAASAVYAYSVAKNIPKANTATQSELKQMITSSLAPRTVIYGKTYVSGTLLFAEEQIGDEKNSDGYYEETLHLAVGFCDHTVHAIDVIDLNESSINDFGSKASYQIHNGSTSVDSTLLANAPSWKSDMIGPNCFWMRYSLVYDSDLFSSGVPTPRCLIRGKKIYDPRTGATAYSNNAALVILDFFMSYRNIPLSRIITTGFGSFIDAANLCDEVVTNKDGSTSKRYTINGAFQMTRTYTSVLTDLLAACGGQLVRRAGSIGLLPAAYYGPATFEIHESDIIADIQLTPEPSYSDAINTIKGTYVDPNQSYADIDFPDVVDDEMLARDGFEKSDSISLAMVTDVYQAQRLAHIYLNRNMAGGDLTLTMNLKGLYCQVGRVVSLNIPTMNLVGEFRVTSQSAHLSDGVELSLVREDADIYDDSVGVSVVAPALTNLRGNSVIAPTSVQFTTEAVGEVVQGYVKWSNEDPRAVRSDIRFKNASTAEVVRVGTSFGDSFKVDGLIAGSYIVEVRSVTAAGYTSSWAAGSIVVSAPTIPSGVTVVASNWSIELKPYITTGTPSGTLFEIQYLADNASYLTDPATYSSSDRSLASTISTASSFTHGGLTPDRWHHYWVRSVNAYGASGWYYLRAGTLREQSLVTTVVERLESIEIVSSNYVSGESGYFIGADGDVEFNDGVFRGTVLLANVEGAVGSYFNGTREAYTPIFRAEANSSLTSSVARLKYKNQPFDRRIIVKFKIDYFIATGDRSGLSVENSFPSSSSILDLSRIASVDSTDGNGVVFRGQTSSLFVNPVYNTVNSGTHLQANNNEFSWIATIPSSTNSDTITCDLYIKFTNKTASKVILKSFSTRSEAHISKLVDDSDLQLTDLN